MSLPEELARAVRARADGRCQYCLMHESLQGATFHIEHIIPLCQGGRSLAQPSKVHRIRQNRVYSPLSGAQMALYC